MAINLASISKTRRIRAPKIVIGGQGKIGKTTFAAMAGNSVGILTEQGTDAIDSQAFPLATSFADVLSAIEVLTKEKHQFDTVFVDSLDWLEPLIQAHVCAANKWESIESPGFGKGYVAAAEEWRKFLHALDALRDKTEMAVILICHDKIKTFSSPLHDAYDIYTLKLHDRASALCLEWADIVGFAGYKVATRSADAGFGQKEKKATTTGDRILHVEPHPAHFGGNRFGLVNGPLDWAAFADQLAAVQQPAAKAA